MYRISIVAFVLALGMWSCGQSNPTPDPETEDPVVDTPENGDEPQWLDPVTWTFSTESLGGGEYNLIYEADIQEGWYLYSQYIDDGGPIPTAFEFEDSTLVGQIGMPEESSDHIKTGFDDMFEMDIKKFSQSAKFVQHVKVDADATVEGWVTFMSCDDSQCIFPDPAEFSFELTAE